MSIPNWCDQKSVLIATGQIEPDNDPADDDVYLDMVDSQIKDKLIEQAFEKCQICGRPVMFDGLCEMCLQTAEQQRSINEQKSFYGRD